MCISSEWGLSGDSALSTARKVQLWGTFGKNTFLSKIWTAGVRFLGTAVSKWSANSCRNWIRCFLSFFSIILTCKLPWDEGRYKSAYRLSYICVEFRSYFRLNTNRFFHRLPSSQKCFGTLRCVVKCHNLYKVIVCATSKRPCTVPARRYHCLFDHQITHWWLTEKNSKKPQSVSYYTSRDSES